LALHALLEILSEAVPAPDILPRQINEQLQQVDLLGLLGLLLEAQSYSV
jgi:hypothetical protein